VSANRLLKWLLISLNKEKLCSAFVDVTGSVHANISKIIMSGKESGSADTKDFIKVSGKSALSYCLDHIFNHLDTSLSNNVGVSRSSCQHSNCSRDGIPSFTINDAIIPSKSLTGQQLSVEKPFCNCYSKISIKGISIDLF